jgi:chemotaxis protein methyltransferase CheR
MADIKPDDYEWIRQFVYAQSANDLGVGKEYLVSSRLSAVARDASLPDISALVTQLRARPLGGPLHQQVMEAMTTNETSFFRDGHPFVALQKEILPTLQAANPTRSLRIWCAAASTGQEPYTIAMVLRSTSEQLAARTRILCTDINTAVLKRTADGIYSQLEVNRGMPATHLVKYFERQGATWRAKQELRSMIDTRVMNLAVPWVGIPPQDVVFLRNVLIYFDAATKMSILNRIRATLAPGGVLFIGCSETLIGMDDGWTRQQAGSTTVYMRAA